MSLECTEDESMIRSHIKLISDNESRSKSNTKRLDMIERLVDSFNSLSNAFTSQAKDLSIMVKTLERHETQIDQIQDRMETKETVLKLHERIDDLEQKDGKRAEQLINQVRNILVGLIVTGLVGLVWTLISK